MNSIFAILISACCVLLPGHLLALQSFSDDLTSGLNPTKISLPKREGTLLNVRGESAINGSTGALGFSYPLPIPAWRQVLSGIELKYDSQGSNGSYGYGFSLSLPKIERSRQFGVPTAATPLQSQKDGELVPVDPPPGSEPGEYYRPRIDNDFHLYRLDGDKIFMSDGHGRTYVFGGNADALERSPDLTVGWVLSKRLMAA